MIVDMARVFELNEGWSPANTNDRDA
jgi:hypothetical protein